MKTNCFRLVLCNRLAAVLQLTYSNSRIDLNVLDASSLANCVPNFTDGLHFKIGRFQNNVNKYDVAYNLCLK